MKKWINVIFLALLLSLLVACGNATEDADEASQNTDTEEAATEDAKTEETSEESAFPLTITDASGKELTIEEEPERIVSLIPSNTEVVFALGQGDKVVGVTENDTYPEEVLEIDKVGDMELNVEVIISLEPDVVLAHESVLEFSQEAYQQLEDAGINLFVVNDAQDIASTYKSIESIGQVIGVPEEAEQLVTEMQEGFAEIEEITSAVAEEDRQSVFFEISPAPDIFTAGQNTFLDELLQVINAENAASELDGWAAVDPEAIIELNPDVIVTTYGFYVDDAKEQVLSRDGFQVVDAVAEERVFDVHSDMVTRPGPRLVEGTRELAASVYPELFNEE